MLHADDAGVVSQSGEKLRKMLRVIVVLCATFGLTASEAKIKVVCLRTKEISAATAIFDVKAAGQVYDRTNEFVCLGGYVNHNPDLSIEVDRRRRNAWFCLRKYTHEMYDQPSAPLEPKLRMLGVEALETVMVGYATKSPRAYPDTLRRAHHSFLTRFVG